MMHRAGLGSPRGATRRLMIVLKTLIAFGIPFSIPFAVISC